MELKLGDIAGRLGAVLEGDGEVVQERVGRELGVPVFLYEHAATRPERRSLAGTP